MGASTAYGTGGLWPHLQNSWPVLRDEETIAHYLEQMLGEALPGVRVEVIPEGLSAGRRTPDRISVLISLYDLALSSQARGDLTGAADARPRDAGSQSARDAAPAAVRRVAREIDARATAGHEAGGALADARHAVRSAAARRAASAAVRADG